jgi:hypothetical protein
VLSQTRAALRWFVTLIVCPRKGAVLFEECVKSTQDIKPVEDTGQRKGVIVGPEMSKLGSTCLNKGFVYA